MTNIPQALQAPLIRQWAEEHRQRMGQWPRQRSGRVEGTPGETWKHLDQALRKGHGGLPGGCSLVGLCEGSAT